MLASWNWIYRWVAIVCALASVGTFLLLPADLGRNPVDLSFRETIKRLDLMGAFLITGSLLLFILVRSRFLRTSYRF